MEKEIALKYLYTALADELLSFYQYWTAKNCSRGEGKSDVDPEFDEHEKEEFDHANQIMQRIKELGGTPLPSPCDWTKVSNPWSAIDTRNIKSILEITIQAEQTAIDFYLEAIEAMKDIDPVTHKLFRGILKDEYKHIYDLKEQLCQLINCDFSDIEQELSITASSSQESFESFSSKIEESIENADTEFLGVVANVDNALSSYLSIKDEIDSYMQKNPEDAELFAEWFTSKSEDIDEIILNLKRIKSKIS